jgi:hypothetical protein
MRTSCVLVPGPLAFPGELMKRESPGLDRIARIEEALAPWRKGPEALDILYWAFVHQALDARPR